MRQDTVQVFAPETVAMPLPRRAHRYTFAFAALAIATSAASLSARAQPAAQWPDHQVRMIVPLGAAAPDGYTLLVVASPHINLEVLSHNKPYVLLRDFAAVAPVASTDAVLVVHPSVPAKTVKELIALAKSKPGALTYASSGPGSNKHLGGELFKLMTGTNILHVPYKSSTGARNDLVGHHVDMMFDEIPSVGPNVLAGQVRALGVTGRKRSHMLPDVPTVSEAGVPGYEHTGWFGIMVPTGTPQPIIDKLNAAIRTVVARPDVKANWEKQDNQTMSMSPKEFDAYLHQELEKWTKVVKEANIKLQ
jgi:tripartite-type tricarboxylate transporter receptor subunit TctC